MRRKKILLCKTVFYPFQSEANGVNEQFTQVLPQDIDVSPLPWHKCDSSKGLLYGVIRHYLIVLKDGYIPPQYITEEK